MHTSQSLTKILHEIPGWGKALILSIGAFILWGISLQYADLDRMTDLGLVSSLPISYFIAVITLIITICTLIYFDESPEFVYVCLIFLLIIMIHGVPPLVYKTLRYPWAWKHVGLVDYILRHHSVDPTIDQLNAYHNWPGFFAHSALLSEIAGLDSSFLYAPWAEAFFNLAEVGALYMIFRGLTDSRRITWLGILIFYLTNWVGQDYYAPQSLAFFLYLTIVGITLRWYRSSLTASLPFTLSSSSDNWFTRTYRWIKEHAERIPEQQIASTPLERMGLVIILSLMIGTIVVTHQLTPSMLIGTLLLLVVLGQINIKTLPIIAVVLALSFTLFGASNFVVRDIAEITGSLGLFSSNIEGNFIDLSQVSTGHRIVAQSGRILTASFWLLAIVGGLRRLYTKHFDLAAVILVLAPCLGVFGNAYGGEILFRVVLFTVAGTAFFCGAAIYPSDLRKRTWYTGLLPSIVVCLFFFSGFFLAHFGKEKLYYLPPDEVEAADFIFSNAPPNTLVIEGADEYPRQFKNYEYFTLVSIRWEPTESQMAVINDPVNVLMDWMSNPEYADSYLIITTRQKLAVDRLGLMPLGSLEDIESALLASDRFTVAYQNRDAKVFVLNESDGSN
jgi:hypothetical protein